MSSANDFNLDQSKIVLFVKELTVCGTCHQMTHNDVQNYSKMKQICVTFIAFIFKILLKCIFFSSTTFKETMGLRL